MKRFFALGMFVALLVNPTQTWSQQNQTAWVVVKKPMHIEPAGVLAKTVMSAALTQAGYNIQQPSQAPKTKAGRPVIPNVTVEIEIRRRKQQGDRAAFDIAIQAMGPGGAMLAASRELSAHFDNSDTSASLSALRQALDRARDKILRQLTQMKNHSAKHGERYMLTFKNMPHLAEMKLHTLLKKSCKRVKLAGMSKSEARFHVRCATDLSALKALLTEGISTKFAGIEVLIEQPSAQSLLIVFP